jgi:hypothetical protein
MVSSHYDEGEIPDSGSSKNSRAAVRLRAHEHAVDSHDRARHGKHSFGEAATAQPRRHPDMTPSRGGSRSPDRGSNHHYRPPPRRYSPEPPRRDGNRGARRGDDRDHHSYRGPQPSYVDLDRPNSGGADTHGSYRGASGRGNNDARDWDRHDRGGPRDRPDRRNRRRSRSPARRDRGGMSRGDSGQKPITLYP